MMCFKTNTKLLYTLRFALVNIFLFISIASYPQLFDTRTTIQKFNSAFQVVSMAYVDSVNHQELTENAIRGMLKELDPHSVYMTKEEIRKANEPLIGNFDGIGVQFQIYKDTILVITPVPGGPSDKLGIMAGDKIVKINGEDATGSKINNDFVMERLRGKRGTEVDITIFRDGQKDLLDFTIVRDKIPLHSIDASFMVSSEIGYIRLSRFARTTMKEFADAVKSLKSKGMQNLILDLRNNSGGFLDVAVDLSDEFLDNDKMIVYTEGLKSPRQDFKATSKGTLHNGRIIVLINEGSASASEIVSGAIQDWDRGLVMGRRSFGKGLVQRPFALPDSSVIRLTTARYFTPAGRSIQKPYNEGVAQYRKELQKRLEHGEMVHADSIRFPDSLKFLTNNKRVVYGGGGIMPDIFLPVDTAFNSKYYNKLARKGVFNSFTLEYTSKNRRRLETDYSDVDDFNIKFYADKAFLDSFVDFAEKEGVTKDEEGLQASGMYIVAMLKALIARNLFDTSAYYVVISSIDKELQQAIKTMNDNKAFKNILVNNQ